MNVDALINIESALLAQEVLLRALGNTDERSGRLLELHHRHVFFNIANAITGIRAELSGYLYSNAPRTTEDSTDE